VIRRFADDFSYGPVTFTSIDSNGQPIYHTNVMMCIGTAFAMVGLEMIPNKVERQQVRARLEKAGKEIVELSADQIANFAGNAIELHTKMERNCLCFPIVLISTNENQRTRCAAMRGLSA